MSANTTTRNTKTCDCTPVMLGAVELHATTCPVVNR